MIFYIKETEKNELVARPGGHPLSGSSWSNLTSPWVRERVSGGTKDIEDPDDLKLCWLEAFPAPLPLCEERQGLVKSAIFLVYYFAQIGCAHGQGQAN